MADEQSFPCVIECASIEDKAQLRQQMFFLELSGEIVHHVEVTGGMEKITCRPRETENVIVLKLPVIQKFSEPLPEWLAFLLVTHGEMSVSRIRQQLRSRGFNFTKKIINPILYKNPQMFDVAGKEGTAPVWKSKEAERTSYDELLDIAESCGANLFSGMIGTSPSKDGTRVACSIVWVDSEGDVAIIGPSKLSEKQAVVFASHRMIRELSNKRLGLQNQLLKLYSLAYERGCEHVRGEFWHQTENEFLEFKGPLDPAVDWTYDNCFQSVSKYISKLIAAFTNTNTIEQTQKIGEVYFGVHTSGEKCGYRIEMSGEDLQKIVMKQKENFRDKVTDLVQGIKIDPVHPVASFIDVELLILSTSAPAPSHIYALLLVRLRPLPLFLACMTAKGYHRRTLAPAKAETLAIGPSEMGLLMERKTK